MHAWEQETNQSKQSKSFSFIVNNDVISREKFYALCLHKRELKKKKSNKLKDDDINFTEIFVLLLRSFFE